MVRQMQRLAALSADERWLLACAAAMVTSMRVALWLFPFRWVCRHARRRRTIARRLEAMPVSRLAWAVQAAARRVPAASCLTQALALQWLLVRTGHGASLRIGVAKNAAHGFKAHAWVECEGNILLENRKAVDRFAPILSLRAG